MDVLGDQGRRSFCPGLMSIARKGAVLPELWTDAPPQHDLATRQLLCGRTSKDAPLVSELARASLGLPEPKILAAGVPGFSDASGHGIPHRALSLSSPLDSSSATSISGDPSLGPADAAFTANQRILRIAAALGDRSGRSAVGWNESVREETEADLAAHPHPQAALHGPLSDAITARLCAGESYIPPEAVDDWTTDLAIRTMEVHRPALTTIAFSTTDLAHRGPWRTYTQALQRIDQLVLTLHRFLERDPFYGGRTTLIVTPDIGRGTDRFDGHDAADPAVRRLFLVATGPKIKAGVEQRARRNQLDVAPTVARLLGFELADGDGTPIAEISS